MEMTIDKAINGVEKRILPIFDNDADHKALEIAIDIMCKYQKIEEEISQWHNDGTNWSDLRLMAIERILEDGNNK